MLELKKTLALANALILSYSVLAQEIVFSKEDFAKAIGYINNEDVIIPVYNGHHEPSSYKKANIRWHIDFKTFDDSFAIDFVHGRKLFSMYTSLDFEQPVFKKYKKEHLSYSNFLGSFGNKDNGIFIYTKDSHKKFLVINYNITKNFTTEALLDFKLKGRLFLGHFSHKESFYLLTWKRSTRLFTLYRIGLDNHIFEAIDVDIEKGQFYQDGKALPFPERGRSTDSILAMGKRYYDKDERPVHFIKANIPLDNDVVVQRGKFYVHNDKLLITLDFNKSQTSLISIDLNSYESETHSISKKHAVKADPFNQKANSFFYDDLLFLVRGDKKNVSLNAFRLKDKTHHSLHSFGSKSPYLEEDNLLVTDEIISKFNLVPKEGEKEDIIKKKLRKIMKSGNSIGLRVIENPDSYLVSFGGFSEGNISWIGTFVAVASGAAVAQEIFYIEPIGFSRDESFDFFIDKNTLELTYDEFVNPYQRMQEFLEVEYEGKADKKTKWMKKFNLGTDYFLAYLDKKSKTYYIRKFN